MEYLRCGRKEKIRDAIRPKKSSCSNADFVDGLLNTDFRDKAEILGRVFGLSRGEQEFMKKMCDICGLRNCLVHANEYATEGRAGQVCEIARDMRTLKEEVGNCVLRAEKLVGAIREGQQGTLPRVWPKKCFPADAKKTD